METREIVQRASQVYNLFSIKFDQSTHPTLLQSQLVIKNPVMSKFHYDRKLNRMGVYREDLCVERYKLFVLNSILSDMGDVTLRRVCKTEVVR